MEPSKDLVFVVAHDPAIRDSAGELVRQAGLSFLGFDSAAACLAALAQRTPMLILLDSDLGTSRGDECCRAIQDRDAPPMPVIMMTSPDAPHEVMHCWRAGAYDFLPKPLRASQLVPKLHAVHSAKARTQKQVGSGAHILFVDDSSFYRKTIGTALEHCGYHVLYAKTAAEARLLGEKNAEQIDICILDFMLPDGNGFEVLAHFRKIPELVKKPVILLTAHAEQLASASDPFAPKLPTVDKKEGPLDLLLSRIMEILKPPNTALRAAERIPFFSVAEFSVDGTNWMSGFTYDISEGGVFIRTLTAMPVGTQVQVKLTMGGGKATHPCSGRVAWSNPYDPISPFSYPLGMGVIFSELADELRERVNRLVTKTAQARVAKPPRKPPG